MKKIKSKYMENIQALFGNYFLKQSFVLYDKK